jgi:hypothetical protein
LKIQSSRGQVHSSTEPAADHDPQNQAGGLELRADLSRRAFLAAVAGMMAESPVPAASPGLFTDLGQALAQPAAARTLLLNRIPLTALPDEIALLPNLQTLLLHRNGLAETPKVLGRLRGLKSIYLGGSPGLDFTALLDLLAELPELTGVGLDDNQMGRLPRNVGHLARCERLGLSSNALSFLPEELASLSRLKALDLYNNQLAAVAPAILALPHLEKVFVKRSGLDPEQLAKAKAAAPNVLFDDGTPPELYLQLG